VVWEAALLDAMEPPAPQPVSPAIATVETRSAMVNLADLFRRGLENSRAKAGNSKGKSTAAVIGARRVAELLVDGAAREACVVGAVMVMTTLADPPGARVGLEPNAHVPPAGRPEQESAMVPEKMPTELSVS
jgi:hypothetical protein